MLAEFLKDYLPIILFLIIAFGLSLFFIIFDLEIAFVFTWEISLGKICFFGFISMMIFLFILTVGFIYEWKKGALDWE